MREVRGERIFSFDVFDTVLTRLVAKPTDAFLLVKESLIRSRLDLPKPLKDEFVRHRIGAERRARRLSEREDVSLTEIYDVLSRLFSLDKRQRNHLMKFEVGAEAKLIEPVGSVVQAIRNLRTERVKIVFLSDMYLPSLTIRNMLIRAGAFEKGDHLFVSGEVGLSKTSGNLFRHAARELGVPAGRLVHFGDNQWSDVAVPKRIGVRLNEDMRMKLATTARERSVIRRGESRNWLASLVAGVARTSRLARIFADEHSQVIWDTATNVVGPGLFFYVYWVLRNAKKADISVLYFFARDGYLPYKLAKVVNERMGFGLDLRYSYVSREALLIPAFANSPAIEGAWLLTYFEQPSVRAVCAAFGVDPYQIQGELNRFGFPEAGWDEYVLVTERERFIRCFSDPKVKAVLAQAGAERLSATIGYLRQEGYLDHRRIGVVDVGWHGHSQQALGALLDLAGDGVGPEVTGFYFGFGRSLRIFKGHKLRSFCVEHDIRRIFVHSSVLELFGSAPHGKTRRYTIDGDRFAPVLEPERNLDAIDWGVRIQEEGALRFTDQILSVWRDADYDTRTVGLVVKRLVLGFAYKPSEAEARVYGSYPFTCYLIEKDIDALASKLSRWEFWRRVMRRDPVVSLWFPGLFARSGLHFERWLWSLGNYRKVVPSLVKAFLGEQRRYYFERSSDPREGK
jgi:FMN phosphatase YigB (HAD superfamily)